MRAFQKAFRFLNATARTQIVPRANVLSKPPQEIVTATDKAIALLVIHAAILIPSYWIMSHLEDYRTRRSD